jgi:hypothetical protein
VKREIAKTITVIMFGGILFAAPALSGADQAEARTVRRTVTRTTTSYVYRPGHGYGRWVNRRWVPRSRVAGYRSRSRARDFDRDGIPNTRDRDIDGDGVSNRRDDHDYNPRRH